MPANYGLTLGRSCLQRRDISSKTHRKSFKEAWNMTTISSTTSAVGAMATYLNQLKAGAAGTTTSGSTDSSTANTLMSMVQGTDDTSSSGLATLLGTNSSTSGNALSDLLGTTFSTTNGLLTEISSLAASLAAGNTSASTTTGATTGTGTTTGSTSGTDTSTSGTTTTDPAATQAKITKLLNDAFASQQQSFISLLV
jgi:hypothetical protein